jgi:hypothetical protein
MNPPINATNNIVTTEAILSVKPKFDLKLLIRFLNPVSVPLGASAIANRNTRPVSEW